MRSGLDVLVATVVLCAAWSQAGCVASRDYVKPPGRMTTGTAYVLQHGQQQVSAGVVGLELPELGAVLGLRHGLGDFSEVRFNAAHAILGILSTGIGFTLVDTRFFGLGIDAAAIYTKLKSIWLLPDTLREPLERVHLLIIPTDLTASFPVVDWFMANLGVGYVHGEIFGPISVESEVVDAGLGLRLLRIKPSVHIYLSGFFSILLGADLPIAAWGRENVETDVELEPGVRGGVRSVEWVRLPVSSLMSFFSGIEVSFGTDIRTDVRVSVTRNAGVRALSKLAVLPAASITVTY